MQYAWRNVPRYVPHRLPLRWRLLAILGALGIALACLSACATPWSAAQAQIDWVPFVRLHGITYMLQDSALLSSEELGAVYDTVRFRLDGNVHDLNYEAQDGDAAYLDPGAKIYSVQGYRTSFRLAAYTDVPNGAQQLHYYDAQANPAARVGADLLDIGGKVTSIGVQSQNGPEEIGTITDEGQISSLVQMVLSAPVDQKNVPTGGNGPRYYVVFHLRDGTTASRMLDASSAILAWGIHVPQAFAVAIANAAGGTASAG